jgi:hypothetical protein
VLAGIALALALVLALGALASDFEGSRTHAEKIRPLAEQAAAEAIALGSAEDVAGGETVAGVPPPAPVVVDTVVEAPEVFEFAGGELEAEVLGLFTDPEAGVVAVVVEVTNPDPARWIVSAPIQLELLDAAGAVVGSNTAVGTDPVLNEVASIPPGGTAVYVNDTTTPESGDVTTVTDVRVQATGEPTDAVPVELEVRDPVLDSGVFGTSVTGTVANLGAEAREKVRVYAVVRDQSSTVVGAGQGLVEALEPGAESQFQIFLTGESEGELEVWAPPL